MLWGSGELLINGDRHHADHFRQTLDSFQTYDRLQTNFGQTSDVRFLFQTLNLGQGRNVLNWGTAMGEKRLMRKVLGRKTSMVRNVLDPFHIMHDKCIWSKAKLATSKNNLTPAVVSLVVTCSFVFKVVSSFNSCVYNPFKICRGDYFAICAPSAWW